MCIDFFVAFTLLCVTASFSDESLLFLFILFAIANKRKHKMKKKLADKKVEISSGFGLFADNSISKPNVYYQMTSNCLTSCSNNWKAGINKMNDKYNRCDLPKR